MINIDFTDFTNTKPARTSGEKSKVKYFSSLKDDGDETVVRLDYDSPKDFKVVAVHRVVANNKWMAVACLKDSFHETNDNCPLCKSGNKMSTKIFVKLLEYSKTEDGKVTVEPKVWERGVGFVPTVMEAISDAVEDGKIPSGTKIRDIVFKIKRIGAKGSVDTKYKVKVLNPAVCPETEFVKDFSAFENYDLSRHVYYVKTKAELETYLEKGEFPASATTTATTATPVATAKTAPATEVPAHPGVELDLPDDEDVFGGAPAKTETKQEQKVQRYVW